VEWLCHVPEHWGVWKLSHLTNKIGSGKTPSGGADVYQTMGVIFIRSQNVYDDGLRLDDVVYIDSSIDEEMAWSRVQPNDILLNITGASLGRTCIVPKDFSASNVNQHVCIIRMRKTEHASFVSLYLKGNVAKSLYEYVQTGSAREGLNFEQIAALPVPLPPFSEQGAIAAFLDRETGRIDSLITKKKRLVELLREKRAAMISRAVTKGLDPSVKMKPSGVEWLGHVPELWKVKRLKTSAHYVVSNVDKVPNENELPVRLCNYTDVYYNEYITPKMELMETTATAQEIKKFKLQKEDVVITKDSEEWSDIAVPALVKETAANLVCGYHLAIIRPKPNILSGQFLHRLFHASEINHQLQVAATGVTRYGLPKSAIGEAIIPLPPLSEQEAIAAYLDRETGKIDSLIQKIETAVEKLKEYRTALISAAVTGKIDVRETI